MSECSPGARPSAENKENQDKRNRRSAKAVLATRPPNTRGSSDSEHISGPPFICMCRGRPGRPSLRLTF